MKKDKTIILSLILMMLVGTLVVAQISLTSTSKDIAMSKDRLDALKSVTGAKDINPIVSSITCNVKSCWATIYQEGVINSSWVLSDRTYCSEYNLGRTACLEYSNIPESLLESARDNFFKRQLETYADSIISKEVKSGEDKVGGGTLTFKE